VLGFTPTLGQSRVATSKVKTIEGYRVGVCSLAPHTSRVEGHVGAPRWGLR